MKQIRLLVLTGALAFSPLAVAQDEPAEQTPQSATPELVLRDLLVVQADRYDTTANNPALIPTTLSTPIKHRGRSKRRSIDGAYVLKPMPIGLITIEGQLTEPMKLRLTLESGRDRFHAHWPSTAIVGSQFIQWQDLAGADESVPAELFNDEMAWLEPIRASEDRLALQTRGVPTCERMFIYDASFKFKPALKLDMEADQYSLSSESPDQAAPPITVLLRKTDKGWTGDQVAAPWTRPSVKIAGKLGKDNAPIALTEALTPIADLLDQRGYNANEIELALGMIASAGLETSSMSLVYVLPVGIIDEHIRLQVRPTPDQLIRTTIIVLNNVDPNLGSQVNALLDDLSSDKWIVRDRAQQQLTALGQAAIKKVQQLKDNKDPEVAFRARQILEAYDWKMQGDE